MLHNITQTERSSTHNKKRLAIKNGSNTEKKIKKETNSHKLQVM